MAEPPMLQVMGLTIRSSRDRFAAAELFGKLSQRRGRKALRLNSGVRPAYGSRHFRHFYSRTLHMGRRVRWLTFAQRPGA